MEQLFGKVERFDENMNILRKMMKSDDISTKLNSDNEKCSDFQMMSGNIEICSDLIDICKNQQMMGGDLMEQLLKKY